MKKILGLDLGTNSIGWALIEQDFEKKEGQIDGLGSRIIPMSKDVMDKFGSGQSISQTAERTSYRGIRRLYQRDHLRRERLHRVLNMLGWLPKYYSESIDFEKHLGQFKKGKEPKLSRKPVFTRDDHKPTYEFLFKDSFEEMVKELRQTQPQLFTKKENGEETKVPYDWTIYYLRKKALTKKISKEELSWLILNFNQKRGYYQLRGEEEEVNDDKIKTFETLKVGKLIDSGETIKGSGEILYNVYFDNGWKYDKQITKTENWEHKIKEFIVTTSQTKDGDTKRTYKAVDSEQDWIAIKKKTEQDVDQSKKHIGEYIFDSILQNPHQKIRGSLIKTIERKYFKKELKAILEEQAKYHPEFANENLYHKCVEHLYPRNEAHQFNIKNRDLNYLLLEDIIFYQRPLKSQKSSIANCQYESRSYQDKAGVTQKVGVKAAPKSHPAYQEFRLWQFIQNLRIFQKEGKVDGKLMLDIPVTQQCFESEEDWVALYDYLSTRKEVEQKHIIDHLVKQRKIEKDDKDNYRWNYVEGKKYPAGDTRAQFLSRLGKVEGLDNPKEWLTSERELALWHIIYSVTDKHEFETALGTYAKKDTNKLHKDSFVDAFKKFTPFKSEYGAYSVKALNKMLPLMRMGQYWSVGNIHPHTRDRMEKLIDAEFDEQIRDRVRKLTIDLDRIEHFKGLPVWLVGYIVYDRHSEQRDIGKWRSPSDIDKYLEEDFKQHSLRNPIVEQVIKETLRTVRDIWKYYGKGAKDFFDEIHIELGREMKNPADKRKQMTERISENENTNQRIRGILEELKNQGVEARPYSPSHQEILKIYDEGIYQSFDKVDDDIQKIRRNANPTKSEIIRYKLWLEQGYISPYTKAVIPLSDLFSENYQIEHVIPQSRFFDDSLSNKIICESAVNAEKGNQTAYEFIKNNEGSLIELGKNKTVKVLTLVEYESHCNKYFSRNKSKLKKLLSEEVPEGFIERQINDTRYISKFVKSLLTNIVKEEDEQEAVSKHIVPVTGAITDRLKKDWGLNDKWNEIVASRFKRLNALTQSEDYGFWDEKINAFRCQVPSDLAKGFNKKRIDHRHHAMDALVVACATKDHVNYITSLNTERKNYSLVSKLRNHKEVIIKGKKETRPAEYKLPWQTFPVDAKNSLEKTIVSFKQNLRVINQTKNKTWQWREEDGKLKKKLVPQEKGESWAIRKPMHKETVSGKVTLRRKRKNPVSLNNALENPELIADKAIKEIVKAAHKLYAKDLKKVKKHFKENPINHNGATVTKLEVFEWITATANRTALSEKFTRKQLDSVTDTGIQKILEKHLSNYKGTDGKERFDLAFGIDGLEKLNQNLTALNDGKPHAPIYKVRLYEEGSKFPISENEDSSKAKKYVEAAKGTNLFFAIYWDEEKKQRAYETIPLNVVIAHQKQVAHLPKEQRTPVPINTEKGNFLFSLSPNDLVYVPTDEELNNSLSVDLERLIEKHSKQIFKIVSSTGKRLYGLPYAVARTIYDKNEFTSLNKVEFDDSNNSIKARCWKLQIDRLGNITNVIKAK